jgi:type II secretory pathway pseudopilin PulG
MRRTGFTLAEATMALVILGMAAAGVLLPFSSGAAVQAEGLRVTLAAKLANDLMERIVATPADQIVSAWDGRTETQGQVKDAGDVVFTDPMYANFSRQVVCESVRVVPPESGDLPSKFIRVSVQVGYQGREIATLRRLISR